MTSQRTTEAAVAELRDVEDIRQLKARYCYDVDESNWDDLDGLWTEDAVCDYGFFGRYEGRSQIMNGFFRELVANASSFNAHLLHNPIIRIEGDVASGTWYFTAHTTVKSRALWAMGKYLDRYARVKGEWKIASIAVQFKYYTPFDEGWVKTPMWNPV